MNLTGYWSTDLGYVTLLKRLTIEPAHKVSETNCPINKPTGRKQLRSVVGAHVRLRDESVKKLESFKDLWLPALDPKGGLPQPEQVPGNIFRVRRSGRVARRRPAEEAPQPDTPEKRLKAEMNKHKRKRERNRQAPTGDATELADRRLYEDIAEYAEVSRGPQGRFFAIAATWNGKTEKNIQKPYVSGMSTKVSIRHLFNMIGNRFGDSWRDFVYQLDTSRR